MFSFNNRAILRTVVEMLEYRRLFSTAVSLAGTSGSDNFVISFDSSSLMYSFSGGTTSPAAVAASDLSSVSITGGGGSDTLTIDGGSPTVLNDLGADGSSFSVESTTGSTVNFDSTEHLAALTIDSGAAATLLGNGSHVLVANTLIIAGSTDSWTGQLDLTNNDLIVHNGNLPTLTNQIKSGFASGQWTGQGISSSAAAYDSTYLTALGVIQNSVTGSPTGSALYTSFASQTVVNTDVLVRYTFYGDANLDGHVDGSDYSRIDNGYNTHLTGWFNGDFNYDGVVDGSDYTLIDNAFNTQGPSAAPTILPAEPTGVTIIQAITGEIDIQWNPSPDPSVTSYDVYAGTDPAFSPNSNVLLSSGVNTNGYSDYFDTDPTLTWYYKVTSVNSSGVQSLPSTTAGAMMPVSTPDSYTDAPDYSIPPDDTYDVDSDGNQISGNDDAIVKPAADIAGGDLVAFYGAGSIGAFGNIHFGDIVDSLGGTLNSTKDQNGLGLAYYDWQMNSALTDLLASLDTSGDKTISAAEISAQSPITVLGYSWGAVEAVNFTRLLAAPNTHLLGVRRMSGSPKSPSYSYTGGYNLTEAVSIKTLETIDPVLHAVFDLSGLIKSTSGPLENVVTFQNYYEKRGGGTMVEQFLGGPNGIDEGPDYNFEIGNFFSGGIMGDSIASQAQSTAEINVTSTFANLYTYTPYEMDAEGDVIYGRLKGSQVQHDSMPFYLQQMVINDLTNG